MKYFYAPGRAAVPTFFFIDWGFLEAKPTQAVQLFWPSRNAIKLPVTVLGSCRLAGKRAVASSVVRSTETRVTELTDDELAELVTLVRERVIS